MEMTSAVPAFLCLISAPIFAFGTITDVSELSKHLGRNGTTNLSFSITTEVIRSCSTADSSILTKADTTPIFLLNAIKGKEIQLHAGDIIRASGLTTNRWSVFPSCNSVSVIGHREPAAPIHVPIGDIHNGEHPFTLVTVTGLVLDAFLDDIDRGFGHIILTADRTTLALNFFNTSNEYVQARQMIGATISATGIYWPGAPRARRISAPDLSIRSLESIRTLRPAPSDPFSVPDLQSIRDTATAVIDTLGRHRSEGHVIAVWGRNMFMLRDNSDTIINVRLAEEKPPSYGDYVKVCGLPETDRYRLNLKRAIWKKSAGKPFVEPSPTPLSADQLLTTAKSLQEIEPQYHGQTISLIGKVVGLASRGNPSGIIQLSCEDIIIPLDATSIPDVLQNIEIGSVIKATGTCLIMPGSIRPNEPIPQIEEIALILRKVSDIAIIKSPPWWTPSRLVALIVGLFTIIVLILLWNRVLHRVSERRGVALADERMRRMESALKVEERTRIAVELHDSIAQNLTGVSLEIDSAEQLANKNPADMMQHLRIAARTLQSCRNELRNCLWDLRSRALEENDLNEAIRRTIAPQISEATLTIRFNVPRTKLTDDIAYVLMRIVRELAVNAVRHGNAKNVWIAGSMDGNRLMFSVRDDGSGFDPDTRPSVLQGHFGLQGIHERVNQFNGTMEIASTPGHGTKATISLNLPTREQA